jgi:uncharacterized protein
VQKFVRDQPITVFFVLAYSFSWAVWLIGASATRSFEDMMPALMIGSFGPFIAALIVSASSGGWSAVKALLLNVVKWRVPFWCYLCAWLVFPLVMTAGLMLFGFAHAGAVDLLGMGLRLTVAMPLNALLTALFSPGPLGEEPGWRGFALPRLLRLGEWRSSLLLGLIWGFWHLPLAVLFPEFREIVPGVTLPMWLVLYPLSVIAISVMMTQLWKWTGSALIAITFHAVLNFTMATLPTDKLVADYSPLMGGIVVIALFWVAAGVFVGIDRLIVQSRAAVTIAKQPG